MVIEAEFEEIEEPEGELDLSSEDSLPWLESDEEEDAGGFDYTQLFSVAAIALALMAGIVGGIWFLTNRSGDANVVADGSTIEAPEGPYKERPEDPGGKEFAGTGNVAPVVGEGQTREGVMADGSGTGSDSSEGAGSDAAAATTASNSASSATGSGDPGSANASSSSVVGVQVGAYGSRARAETGWQTLTGSTDVLSGVRYRIVKGEADIGTVYRLQALASNRTAADQLCSALKADGLPCQVKP